MLHGSTISASSPNGLISIDFIQCILQYCFKMLCKGSNCWYSLLQKDDKMMM